MSISPSQNSNMIQCEAFQEDPNSKSTTDDSERENVPLKLLDLNDDCLYAIFNSNHVSAMDLASVAQSCKKLKRIATEIFVREHKICDFRSIVVTDFVMAKRLLTTFGSSILELRIDFDPYGLDGAKIVGTILRHCKNLNSLSMESYAIPDDHDDITNVKLLLGQLKALHIKNVEIEWTDGNPCDDFVTPNGHDMDIFENCTSLIDLKIEDCIDFEHNAFVNKFPKLKHFHYACDDEENLLKNTWVPGFILRHRNLKSLKVGALCRYVEVLKMFPIYCKELESLEFCTDAKLTRWIDRSMACLGQLDRLRELKIFWRGQDVTKMLKEFHRSKSLHVLHLESVQGSRDLLPSISGIKTLRCLKLFDVKLHSLDVLAQMTELTALFIVHESGKVESGFDLAKMVNNLINLKKLQFRFKKYRILKRVYVQLVSAVECRPIVTNRHLQVDCNTTGDFNDLLRPTVEFKTFEQA